jgi:N-hydroxyarylamine O-acetyltransferase
MTSRARPSRARSTEASTFMAVRFDHGFDLDAYLERIGYTGARRPTLETLQAIHLRHTRTIPFENLNPLLGWPVHLDARSLQQKLIADRRGGYCYEHNLLLMHALRAMGFDVSGLAARVLWNVPEEVVRPRTHMLLLVDLDDRAYIADVGFGGMTLTGALRLEPEIEQSTPHEPFRLMRAGDGFRLEARIGPMISHTWRALYRFDLQEQVLGDYEMANWYLSHHPESHFVTGLIAARPDVDRRSVLRNNEMAVHHLHGETERRVLTSVNELRSVLEQVFQIRVPHAPELHAALERILAGAAVPLRA